jgi:hypothetical protein
MNSIENGEVTENCMDNERFSNNEDDPQISIELTPTFVKNGKEDELAEKFKKSHEKSDGDEESNEAEVIEEIDITQNEESTEEEFNFNGSYFGNVLGVKGILFGFSVIYIFILLFFYLIFN